MTTTRKNKNEEATIFHVMYLFFLFYWVSLDSSLHVTYRLSLTRGSRKRTVSIGEESLQRPNPMPSPHQKKYNKRTTLAPNLIKVCLRTIYLVEIKKFLLKVF